VVRLRPGGRFQVVARNIGLATVRVVVDDRDARGLRVAGSAELRVPPGQAQMVELEHLEGAEIGGRLLLRSEDAPRREWWERRAWREAEVPLASRVQVREERWIAGASALVFPPGVERQQVRVWNDADVERELRPDIPSGYRLATGAEVVGGRSVRFPAERSAELALETEALLPGNVPDAEWQLLPDAAGLPLIRLTTAAGETDADVVVAIDFGTRNTSLRVRWRRTLVSTKPAGTVDAVGDRDDSPRFPTQMVLHLQDLSFRWGSDAAEYALARRMTADEIAVDNLKTYLREGHQRFVHLHSEWTNEELLARYFQRIFQRLDEYFRSADPGCSLQRSGLRVRYVVTRPVLDANEGDEVGRKYERALLDALARCGVSEDEVVLVQEPVAAAVGIGRRRAGELLSLADGAPIAVVDSGGGTSHVAVGKVRLEDGRVSLDLSGSYALRLADDNPALEAILALEKHGFEGRREVGGNVLDSTLLFGLATEADQLLESDGPPIPRNIWLRAGERPAPAGSVAAQSRVRDIRTIARRMKERFARASTQYLNRPPGASREDGEVLPFPHREDLQGIALVHALYDEHVLAPTLDSVVGELSARIQATQGAEGIRPGDVRRVFYVGGTNVDPFVRLRFGRAFPLAPSEIEAASQSDERIAERLHAVVDGAVWFGEQLYAPAPLRLTLRLVERLETVVTAGAPLLPAALASPRFYPCLLQPGEELDAGLQASGDEAASWEVARGFYRNESGVAEEVVLSLTVSREQGCVAELQTRAGRLPQWRVLLAEGAR
jgi:molecular chaperone DnaK (HSP70)